MDILMMVMEETWELFCSVALPITYQGVTYNITLYGLLMFTTIVTIAVCLIFSAFD